MTFLGLLVVDGGLSGPQWGVVDFGGPGRVETVVLAARLFVARDQSAVLAELLGTSRRRGGSSSMGTSP